MTAVATHQYDEPIGPQLPSSANGYLLIINGFVEVASWPAAFFALHIDDATGEPLLQHCETLADAVWRTERGGRILNADFTEYVACAAAA